MSPRPGEGHHVVHGQTLARQRRRLRPSGCNNLQQTINFDASMVRLVLTAARIPNETQVRQQGLLLKDEWLNMPHHRYKVGCLRGPLQTDYDNLSNLLIFLPLLSMSAFGYLLDRSVGLPTRDYRDNLHARQSAELLRHAPSSGNFIFRRGMRVWSLSLDPMEQRYLLVGTSQSQLLLFDLLTLDEADFPSNPNPFNTTNILDPVCCVGAKPKVPPPSP